VGETRYTNEIAPPYTRIRVAFGTIRGDVDWFVVNLEYNVSENTTLYDEWKTVARFDHNPSAVNGHDIRDEGLHIDLCDPDGSVNKGYGFPPVSVNEAPAYCETYFKKHHLRITRRYAKLAGIENWNRPTRR